MGAGEGDILSHGEAGHSQHHIMISLVIYSSNSDVEYIYFIETKQSCRYSN